MCRVGTVLCPPTSGCLSTSASLMICTHPIYSGVQCGHPRVAVGVCGN